MDKKIIVTGGAGFIGSAVVWGLNNRGIYDITIVDLEENLNRDNIKELRFFEKLCYKKFRAEVLKGLWDDKGIDCIFHLGAHASTTEKDWEKLKEDNIEYSKILARFANRKNIRFIYASSAATYGDGSLGFNDEREIEKLQPLNLYGESKQRFDIWAKQNKFLDKIVGLKYFNVYGPNEYHKGDMRSFISKAYEQIKSTGEVKLFKSYKEEYKDGEQERDFIYIKDAIDMTLFFFDNRDKNGIYNIGTGFAHTWNELVNAVFDALNVERKIKYIDMPQELKEQYQYYTKAEVNKIKRAGYNKQMTEFNLAIKDYVCNYLEPQAHL